MLPTTIIKTLNAGISDRRMKLSFQMSVRDVENWHWSRFVCIWWTSAVCCHSSLYWLRWLKLCFTTTFLIFGLMYSTFTFSPLYEFNFLFYKTTIPESVSPNICCARLSFRDWNPKQEHIKQMWHTYRIRENVAEWDMLTVLVSDVKVTNKSLT